MNKKANLQVTRRIQQQIARLEIAMQNVRRVNVLQSAEDLVQKVADVVVAEFLGLQQLVKVCLH